MTIEPHAVAFQFGTAVPQQAPGIHPVIKALAAGKITLSAAVTQAPFLDWPAEALTPWQGTIAAIMQKTAKDEGNVKAAPATPQDNQNAARSANARKTGAILELLKAKPWAFGGEIAEPCRMSITSCFSFLRALEMSGQVQVALTREGKRYALAGHPPFFRAAIKRDDIEARLLAVLAAKPGMPTYRVREAVKANKNAVNAALAKLLEEGKIIAERGPSKGSMWSIRVEAAQ